MRGVKGGTQSGLSEEKEWKVWKESLCVCVCVVGEENLCVCVCWHTHAMHAYGGYSGTPSSGPHT